MRILVCGGCGFIGSHFVRQRVQAGDDVTVLDKLTYAGNTKNLHDVPVESVHAGAIEDQELVRRLLRNVDPQAVVNFAAETHVDRSISDAQAFLNTNVIGTHRLLEACRQRGYVRFVQVSTDEVYGPVGFGACFEDAALDPSSPYSASKAAGDLLVGSYHWTYGLNTVIVRGSNAYGPYQYPEKLIPLMILKALAGEEMPVYGDGQQIREWIHVEDFARGIGVALDYGREGEVYNCGGGLEHANLAVVSRIVELCGAAGARIKHVQDRPGHDERYSLHSEKLRRLGWYPEITFEEGLPDTIDWYRQNQWWWQPVLEGGGPYLRYLEKQYGEPAGSTA